MTGQDVKDLRKKWNISQKALADGLGIPLRTVQVWEYRGTISPGYKALLNHLKSCHKLRVKVTRRKTRGFFDKANEKF